MTWLKLTATALYLVDGTAAKAKLDVQKKDPKTFVLNVPLNWLQAADAPTVLVVDFGSFAEPVPEVARWKGFYGGLELDGAKIPQGAIANPTVGGQEGLGVVAQLDGQNFVKGKVAWFGGSEDGSIAEDETATLTCERLKTLNDPKDYYCAMRWSFEPNGRRFWANQRLLVVNPLNQKAVVVRAVDWGPPSKTGRILSLSKNALTALDAKTDEELLISFAKPSNQAVGPV